MTLSPAAPPDQHLPQHGDAVEQWLVRWRESLAHAIELTPYEALGALVADYRGHADERLLMSREEAVTE